MHTILGKPEAAAGREQTHHRETLTTLQQQHVLYTSACDELHIPDKATDIRMQQIACEVYQEIWSYADHFLAILRILSLASTGEKKSGKRAESPLQQLKQLVAKGWTPDQGQHTKMQEGMSRMGLAICLTQLLSEKQLKAGINDLTSHHADYVYRIAALQYQYQPPLFLSQRRHCGHNKHATQLADPILINTANNSEHHLRQGDLHALLQPARHEYEKRYLQTQCDTCYKPGMVRQEWKVFTGQLAILQLIPASGDRYLPTMRNKGHEQERIILHNLRNRKAKLWGKECTVTGALLGLASNPDELAETAFLQLPTKESPNKYHIYQGTGCSRTIEQEHIPSWWVILALVLKDTDTRQGPALHQPQCPQHKSTTQKSRT